MDLRSLDYLIRNKEKMVDKEITSRDLFKKEKESLEENLKDAETNMYDATAARDLLEKATTSAQESGKLLLEETTTKIVQMVFGPAYEIEIGFKVKGNVPVADVYFKKKINHNYELINVENEGGGLRDIVSIAFFVAIGKILGKENDNKALLTLDEPTPAVSSGNAEYTAEAIQTLMESANKQSLIITHEREYLPNLIDNVYYVEQSADGVSNAERL